MRSEKQARLAHHVTRLGNSAQVVKTLNQNRKIEADVIFLPLSHLQIGSRSAAAPACVCVCVCEPRAADLCSINKFI